MGHDDPRWVLVNMDNIGHLRRPVSLPESKEDPKPEGIMVARRSRLSIEPVDKRHYHRIIKPGQGIDEG